MHVTYTTYSAPDWPLDRHIDLALKLGCEALELRSLANKPVSPDMPKDEQEATADTIMDAGLTICVVGSDCRFAIPSARDRRKEIDRAIEFVRLADTWRAPIVRVFGGLYDPGPSDAEVNQWVAESLREIAQVGLEHGIMIALETHDAFSSGQRVRHVIDLAAHPSIGALWDFAHPVRAGESVSETWALIGDHTVHAHFKDMVQISTDYDERERYFGTWKAVLPGRGNLPLHEMVAHLTSADFDGYISTEWEGGKSDGPIDPATVLETHTSYLQDLITKTNVPQ
jgi:fatty-acyl-CoA synthase